MTFALLFTAGWTIAQAQSAGAQSPAQRIGLTLEDNRSVYTTVGEQNQYENDLRLNQPTGDYKLTAGLLYNGDNYIVLKRVDDQGEETPAARINLNAVKTVAESEILTILDFYDDGNNPPSSQTTITQAMLPDNWGTNGSNLIWKTSGYAYISGQGGLTYTVPAGYSDATFQFIIYIGSNARGGYWAYNLNDGGWSLAATATAGGSSVITVGGVSSGDVISLYGGRAYNNQYQLYQSPDIDLIGVVYLPSSYIPTIEVTPAISYWNDGDWSAETSLGASTTYGPNDNIDLYGLGTITDSFTASTENNDHSDYYTYSASFDGDIILPTGSSTGTDFYASIDFTACTTSDPGSGTKTGYDGWTFNEAAAYSSSGIISAYIQYYGDMIFTMPNNFMGTSVQVTVTSSTGSDGAGILFVNGESHTFTAGSSYTWTVPVGANGIIEFTSDGQTYSVDIANIVVRSGNGSALNAPIQTNTSEYIRLPKGLKAVKAQPIAESEKVLNREISITDK